MYVVRIKMKNIYRMKKTTSLKGMLRMAAAAVLLILVAGCKTKENVRVHIIGDSTMADYVENTTHTRGWGEMLQSFFGPKVQVANYARGGRSSHSFYKEGLWKVVSDSIRPGDYVLIQFAHNDEKEGGKDGADGRGTAPWTTYKRYIERYVDEARERKATPVLVTPIIRRYFTSDGTISPKGCHDLSVAPDDSTLNYVRVMKHVARNKNVQLVDMTAATKDFAENLGSEQTIRCIYVPTDGTHTQATGAACYAKIAVEGLKDKGILARQIRDDIPLVLNPDRLDFKTIFEGEKSVVCFDLTGLNLTPAAGKLAVTAPKGMLIADSPHGIAKQSLTYQYYDGKLWNKCFYLSFQPQKAGRVRENVVITYGASRKRLPVVAEVKEVSERLPVSLTVERPVLRGLVRAEQGITIEGNEWSAEIDEAARRYVEVVVPPVENTVLLNSLSLYVDGEVAYRIACAYGKDFYPRTDIGEEQTPEKGRRNVTLPLNVTLNPGQKLHIRLFPWSTMASDNLHFTIGDWKVEGSIVK